MGELENWSAVSKLGDALKKKFGAGRPTCSPPTRHPELMRLSRPSAPRCSTARLNALLNTNRIGSNRPK